MFSVLVPFESKIIIIFRLEELRRQTVRAQSKPARAINLFYCLVSEERTGVGGPAREI